MTIGGFDSLVEARIERAIARGELSGLPGQGRPFALDDESFVAPELRLAHRILKNAGYVPEEVELRRQIACLGALVDAAQGAERAGAIKRRDWLRARLAVRGHDARLYEQHDYAARITERVRRCTTEADSD